MKVKLNVNHQEKIFDVSPGEYLLDTLRSHDYLSVRRGCDSTSCGVCTVLVNGKPVPSCSVLSAGLEGAMIITVEGIQAEAEKLSHYFGEEGADQCGFCNPSLAITVYAMKKELTNPTLEDIKNYLVGNLCRCTGYISQEKAIQKYLEDKS